MRGSITRSDWVPWRRGQCGPCVCSPPGPPSGTQGARLRLRWSAVGAPRPRRGRCDGGRTAAISSFRRGAREARSPLPPVTCPECRSRSVVSRRTSLCSLDTGITAHGPCGIPYSGDQQALTRSDRTGPAGHRAPRDDDEGAGYSPAPSVTTASPWPRTSFASTTSTMRVASRPTSACSCSLVV